MSTLNDARMPSLKDKILDQEKAAKPTASEGTKPKPKKAKSKVEKLGKKRK